jgi:hypothetical protein
MAENPFQGIPNPIQPGFTSQSPLTVFRESMGTLSPRVPNGEPMSVPAGLNLAGNYQSGPNPVSRRANGTMDALNQNVNFLNQADNWARDRNAYGRTYFYGAGIHGANFERYYSHPQFKNLGFNPLRNNETVYNENSSWWDDFNRMGSAYSGLFMAGFKSMYDFGSKDTAREYEKAMALGMSTRGGVGGFFTNLALNSGFTMGLMTEMIAENFAIAGLTVATGGLAAAPAAAAAIGKNGMVFQKLFQGAEAMKSTLQTFKEVDNANSLRQAFKAGEGATATNRIFDTLNPLSRTAEYMTNLSKGANGFDKLNDFVKTRKAFGALYRDIREINAVFSESLMEGEMAKNENNRKAIDNYYRKNGVMPEGAEAQKIFEMSNSIGFATSLANAPAIYFSNKLIFDNIFNGFKPPSVVGQELIQGSKRSLTRNKDWKLGDNVYSFAERTSSKKMKDILFNSPYVPWSRKYAIGNLAEGLQESLQDVASSASTKYYEELYNDPTAAGMYNALNAVGSAGADQFSVKGFETFLSGFLMGSLVQPVGAAMTNHKWAPTLYNKYFNTEEYKKEVQKQRDNENDVINAVNTILKNPLGYFDRNVEHALRTKKTAEEMNAAEQRGDQKSFQDAKDQLTFEHMMTLAETGKLDLLDEHFDKLMDLDNKELSEAFSQSVTEGDSIRKRLEDAKQQVLEFRNTYDAFVDKYQNPFNPRAYNPDKDKQGWNQEMARFIGYEEARRDAILSNVLYRKTVSRMESLYSGLSADKFIKNAKTNDFTVLLSQDNLRDEISLLSKEVAFLKEGNAEQKSQAKIKQQKLDALKDFMNYSLQYQMALAENKKKLTADEKKARSLSLGSTVKNKRTGEKVTIIKDMGDFVQVETKSGIKKRFKKTNLLPVTSGVVNAMREANKGLYKVFTQYVKAVAVEANDKQVSKEAIDNAFIKVRDWFNLREDSQNLIDTANILNNPSAFMRHAENQAMIQAFKRENLPAYIKVSYRNMQEKQKDNSFLNEIFDLGFTVDPDDISRIVYNEDYTNINFYYQTTGEPVESTDPKLVEANKIVEKYKEISRIKKEAEDKSDGIEKPAEEEKEGEVEQKPEEPTEKVEEEIPNYEIYKQLVALFRKSEAQKAQMGEATSGLENVNDYELRNQQAFLAFITSNSEAIALTEKLPKPEEKGKPTEEEIKEEDWTPQPVPAGLEKLKNLYKEVLKLTKDEKNYFNSEGELWDRVSSIKREKQGLPGEDILKLSAQRGNVIDIVIREMFKGNIQNKVDMLNLIKGIIRKENYSVQFDTRGVNELYTILNDVYNSVKAEGFKIYSDIPTLFGTIKGMNTPQGGNIAGTIDLLAEKDGKFYIIDLKTATADRKSEEGKGRYLEDDTIQLNAYRELIKQQTGVDIEGIFIFPMTVTQGKGYKVISSVTAPKFTMDELISIEKKSLKELRPELFEETPGAPTPAAPTAPAPTATVTTKNTISNGDRIIDVQNKPVTNEITDTAEDLFILPDNNPEGRIHINMDPLKDILVVPNNTLTIIDKTTGKEIVKQELNPEGAVIFEAMQGRLFVVAKINGQLVPFYKSSAGTSGKVQGAWYPFFGYTGAWLVKGGIDKATGKMSYSPEIDRVTDLLNENLVFPDQYLSRVTNTINNTKGEVIIDMNQAFKINRLWQKAFQSQTGNKTNYSIKGLKDNTTSESGVVALITGLNSTELDSSKTPKELSEWFNLITENAKEAAPAPVTPAPTATAGPLNGIGSVSFDIPGVTLEGFEIDGNRYNVLTHFERAKTLVNINGVIVPFYLTSGSGGKGLIPGWYPFAGIGQDGWLNKTGKADMETYYSRLIGAENADMLKRVAQKLNETYGTDPAAYKPDADPTAKDKPISTMAEKTEDYINSKLSFKPVSNNTSTTLSGFEANMRQLGDALTNARGAAPAAPTQVAPMEEVKTEPEVKGETLESMVEEAKTPAGYETLRGKLLEKLRTDAAFRNKYNLTAESVKEILKNKYNELAMTFTAEDIKSDKKTFMILKDGTQAMVVDRTKSTFTYQRMVDGAPEGAVVERPLSQLYDVVQSIYKAGMENIKPVEPAVAEPVAADSKKESDNSLKDAEDPGVIQDTANEAIASTMTKDEALENLKNTIC